MRGDRAALEERVRREAARPRPGFEVSAWQIRVERDGAVVGEDYEVAGPDGAPAARRARYRLVPRGERWLVAGGL